MFPNMLEPFFSIARTNAEAYFRWTSSIADGLRQLHDVNRNAMQTAISDMQPRWENGAVQRTPLELIAQWPQQAASYGSEVFATIDTTMRKMIDAVGASSWNAQGGSPTLVLVDVSTETPTLGLGSEHVIVDERGQIVK
jgi:hypothetical protein